MSVPVEFTYFPDSRSSAIVVSHERSGTHFLMNALAACYGYVSRPWINFDHHRDSVLQHYTRPQIGDLLLNLCARPMANVVKSHHPIDFFADELKRLTQKYVFFSIYRNPIDVMLSCWRFMYNFQPKENFGPLTPDPVTFARTAPAGLILRYQTQPYETMLARWSAHIQGWQKAAAANPRVLLVRYEDLDARYEETMRGFEAVLGRPPQALTRPSRDYNVIRRGPADPIGTQAPPDLDALARLCRETAGDTMALLGY